MKNMCLIAVHMQFDEGVRCKTLFVVSSNVSYNQIKK